MIIHFNSAWTISQTKTYNGQLDNGNTFVIIATYDSHEWSVDNIMFDNPSDDTEENRESISTEFLSGMW